MAPKTKLQDHPPAEIDRITPTLCPSGRVVMRQRWAHLLFLHWAVPISYFDGRIPPELVLDTFEGMAYVGLIPFTMTGIRPPWSPSIPGVSDFHETNLRTYVHLNGRDPGVWFFSLDAGNALGVGIARTLWRLPYHMAKMDVAAAEDGTVRYASERLWPKPTPATAEIVCRPEGESKASEPGSLEHFLLERYILYSQKDNRIFCGQVHHQAYAARPAQVLHLDESLLSAAGFERPTTPPIAHYASEVDVRVFALRPA
jgi:uncharacterized protein